MNTTNILHHLVCWFGSCCRFLSRVFHLHPTMRVSLKSPFSRQNRCYFVRCLTDKKMCSWRPVWSLWSMHGSTDSTWLTCWQQIISTTTTTPCRELLYVSLCNKSHSHRLGEENCTMTSWRSWSNLNRTSTMRGSESDLFWFTTINLIVSLLRRLGSYLR